MFLVAASIAVFAVFAGAAPPQRQDDVALHGHDFVACVVEVMRAIGYEEGMYTVVVVIVVVVLTKLLAG